MERIHSRFERHGVDLWAAREAGSPEAATCQHQCELNAAGYTRVFRALGAAAGREGLTDLGAGCGLAIAHAVGTGAFKRALGVEIVGERVTAANAALRDLKLRKRGTVTHGNFCAPDFQVQTPCAFCFDVVFDRPTLAALAAKLDASDTCRAFASFKPPSRWAEAGLSAYDMSFSERVSTNGGERFTYFLYKKRL
jgi:hypothetical protein